jgi:hypothetical protein
MRASNDIWIRVGNLIDSVLTLHGKPVQTQGRNIRTYSEYLLERAVQYGSTKVDYVRGGEGRLKRLTVDKGLLRETESVQTQIKMLLRCEVFCLWNTTLSGLWLISLSSLQKIPKTKSR